MPLQLMLSEAKGGFKKCDFFNGILNHPSFAKKNEVLFDPPADCVIIVLLLLRQRKMKKKNWRKRRRRKTSLDLFFVSPLSEKETDLHWTWYEFATFSKFKGTLSPPYIIQCIFFILGLDIIIFTDFLNWHTIVESYFVRPPESYRTWMCVNFNSPPYVSSQQFP